MKNKLKLNKQDKMQDRKVPLIFHHTQGHMQNKTPGTRDVVNVLRESPEGRTKFYLDPHPIM